MSDVTGLLAGMAGGAATGWDAGRKRKYENEVAAAKRSAQESAAAPRAALKQQFGLR